MKPIGEFLIAMAIVMLIVLTVIAALQPREAPIAISASVHRAQWFCPIGPSPPPRVKRILDAPNPWEPDQRKTA